MWRLLRFLIVGVWPPESSNRDLARRLREVESRCDYLERDQRKLRGRLVGGIRYVPDQVVDGEDDPDGFPDEAFNRLERSLRSGKEPNNDEDAA